MMKLLLWILVAFAAIIEAQVTSPSSGTVWVNGNNAIITWDSIAGTEFTIVLTRSGTIYHHTITSTAPNTGSFSWIVDIPSTDGWPTSTSSDMVYEIDFYVNGGWNNGGTLVASSQEFAIQYSGGSDPPPVDPPVIVTTIINPPPADPTTITIFSPAANGAFVTTVQTEVIVGVTTMTTVITAVYQVATQNPTNALIVTTTLPPPVITVTITNTQQLSPNATQPTTASTTFVTTYIGATTIGTTATPTTSLAPQPLYNSAAAKVLDTMWLSLVAMLSCVVIVFM
jgi:hypothetical protein